MWKSSLIIGLLLVAVAAYFFWTSRSEQNTLQVAPKAAVTEETPRHKTQ